MSLRLKALLGFSVTILLLFAIVLALVTAIIEKQFTQIEVEDIIRHADHLSAEITEEIAPVIRTMGDWAAWDDIYQYVAGRNPDFPERNLNNVDLENIGLDFISIWKQDGTLFAIKSLDERLSWYEVSSDQLESTIGELGLVPQLDFKRPASGLMLCGGRLTLVVAIPIIQSDRSGPIAGTIVAGRIMGPREIEGLEEFTEYKVQLLPFKSSSGDEGASVQRGVKVVIHGSNQISASFPIFDPTGRMIGKAELVSHRSLHAQAKRTIYIFVIALASLAGILLCVVWYLLDTNVIFPIRRMAEKLEKAALSGDLPSDLKAGGRGELADLAGRIEDLALALASAEANYRGIVEDQTEFIFRYSPDGSITFANGALCIFLNITREALLGKCIHDLVVEEDKPLLLENLDRLSRDSEVITFDHRVWSPCGSERWWRRTERAIFSQKGEIREYQAVARDVTQSRISQQRIEASETRYRRLFETAADGILIVGRDSGLVADANPAVCNILQLSRSDLLGQVVDLLPPFRNRRTSLILNKLLTVTEDIGDTEIILPTSDSELRYVEVTASVYDEEGEHVIQLNFRDVTVRRRVSDELRLLSGNLMRLQDAERRRIARDLHDSTAQNLSALQMSLAKVQSAVSPEDKETLATVEEIRVLTDLSLKEVRTLSYLLHPPLLDEVGLLFALRWYVDGFMTRTEKVVRLDVSDYLPRFSPEIETTVFRIVQEALGNVHRHSGAKRAWIRLTLDGNFICLEVRDDGHGMKSNILGRRPIGSALPGVGIAGMRERLRQFGGKLEVDSSRNGTIIRATLRWQQ